jgi:RNA polymerase sigma-B factor
VSALNPHTSDQQLFTAYHDLGDERARDALVERFLPLARKLALRYRYTREPMDDLFQVACLGLVKAIDRFDPHRPSRFTSFAAPTILGELKRHFRDKGWTIHVPRELQERVLTLSRQTERLASTQGREPTTTELADSLHWTPEEVDQAREVAGGYDPASLDAPARGEDGERPASLIDLLGSAEDGYELAEERDALIRSWHCLSDLERRVVAMRCLHDMTQREIGERIGFSQMHVSRLLRRSLTRLIDEAEAA